MGQIKDKITELRNIIVKAEEDIAGLQSECLHTVTRRVNWSWRVGSSSPAEVCAECGKFIKYLDN